MEKYKSIEEETVAQFIEKRSKFICYACPINGEREANEYVKKISSRHWDAKHNVYAYRVREPQIDRYSDDGEPQGTGGIPILNVLRGENLEDVVVVVTRYFGGILLGTGGLVRAYTHGAKIAIENSNVILMRKSKKIRIKVDYQNYGKVENTLNKNGVQIQNIVFLEDVSIIFIAEDEKIESIEKILRKIVSGKIFLEILEEKYCYFK